MPLWEKEKNLAKWLRRHVTSRPIKDLHRDLADGVVLCGLMEALLPGACPRYDLLSRDNPSSNLRVASRLAASFFGVKEVMEGCGRGVGGAWESWGGWGAGRVTC